MSSKIVVTSCSINHLALAKGLADSVVKYNPEYSVIIGLADKFPTDFDTFFYKPHKLVEAHELHLPMFENMYNRYNTFELNCALKSFFVRWALDEFMPEYIIYLDGDILVFDSFSPLENMLKNFSILITPHITTPFPEDDYVPKENDILKTGTYNAGFFAVKNDVTGNALINWWKERMVSYCYERPKDGLNVDQNWLNLAPLYFDNIKTVKHPGCNVAYWNLHERNIEKRGDKFSINNEPLVFFHYSGYSFRYPERISKHQDRFKMNDNIATKELFQLYHDTLLKNGHPKTSSIAPFYESKKSFLKKIGLKK